ncbi:MAG: hypothetical protein J6W96_02430 [Alphaproteobacteria bacterium]|nr:hypothetical protein [Alphaproteobacteria bacterium]
MKKTLVALFAVLFAFNANAVDLVGGLNKVSTTADTAAKTIEAQKAANEQAKANSAAVVDQAKADAQAAVEAKKAEALKVVEDQKAASDAKTAEQKKAVEDTKNSLNNLKNAFSK